MKTLLLASAGLFSAAGAVAAEPAADADALAKALSNPVAALISVPFQLNYDGISENWNMISRTILPVIEQDNVVNEDSQSGLGDTVHLSNSQSESSY